MASLKKVWERIKPVVPKEVAVPVEVGRWWRRNRVWKRIRGKEIDPPRELTSEGIEVETGDDEMKLLEKLRTSTKSGIAGVVTFAILGALGHFAPEFPTVGLEEWLTAVVMYFTARWSKTPANPGKL